jgi:uncharacterized membrane protein YfcA
MLLGHPLGEIAFLVVLILVAGVLVGVLAGLFGIGGGAIIVPVLYEVFRVLGVPEEVRMQLCVGTSLAIIVPTTVLSYLAHKAKGAVIEGVVRIWSLPAIVGVAIGPYLASNAPAIVFKVAFVMFVVLIAIRMLSGTDRWNLGSELPGRIPLTIYGFITGFVASLVGVSGGAISNMVLTSYGRPMQQAVATSAGVGVPITIVGTIGYIIAGWPHMTQLPPASFGFVSLLGFALMAPVSSYTTRYGVQLAHWVSRRTLEIAFGIFLVLIALRFIASLL